MPQKIIPPVILENIAFLYGFSPTTLTPMATGNSLAPVFQYSVPGRTCILKVIPPNPEIDRPSMCSILDWMAFLAHGGGPVVSPVRSEQGNLLETVESLGNEWISVVFDKAPGRLAETLPIEAWNDDLYQQLGRTLGHCHSLATQYHPSPGILPRLQWEAGDNCFHPQAELAAVEPVIKKKYSRWLEVIHELPRDEENHGLVHLDLHLANFLVNEKTGRFTLIDFDDCGYGWFAMDIAMLLFDVLVVYGEQDQIRLAERFLHFFLAGYREHKLLNGYWVSQIPVFLKLLEIGVYLQCNPPYNPETAGEWDRKFLPGRLERILEEVPYVDLDFDHLE